MDLLDQRLLDAGLAWRQTQPEPPDLDRMIVALGRRRSSLFQGRLMYAVVSGLLLLVAVAVAPGVGSFLHQFQTNPPVLTSPAPSQRPSQPADSPEPTPASPAPSPSASLSDQEVANDVVDRYETALVAGEWRTAFDLLAATSLTHEAGFDEFASERAAFFDSVNGRYVIGHPTVATDWATYGPLVAGADRTRAWFIEVDYPALSKNNAGYEQFVLAPDSSGTWRIWPVR
ncbi:MAG TPA: hypothetical protein VGJ71_11990 [Candidatus Limnocylindrales bacterium]|jgi:hypothetical protein